MVAANVAASLIQFLTLPLTIIWIGGLGAYGIFSILYSVTNSIMIASPNVVAQSQKRITEAFHQKDIALAWRIQQTQLFIGLGAILLLLPLFILLGFFYHIPGSHVPRQTILTMCLTAGVAYCMAMLNSTLVSVLAALERFRELAIRQTLEKMAGTIVTLSLAFLWRSPIAMFVGWAMGGAIGLMINLFTLKRTCPGIPLRPRRDPVIMRDLLHLFFLGYPHRVFAGLGGPIDRAVMPYGGATESMVGSYNADYRLPEAINSVLYPVTSIVVPDLTRKASSDPVAFGNSLDRQARLCLWLATCFILVPCSFGRPFLHVYLHGMSAQNGHLVMVAIGLYYAIQFYIALLTTPFYAKGTLQYATVFSGFNALATLVFTIPAFKIAGIAGVGFMNAFISLAQFLPYPAYVKRFAAPHFPLASHMMKASAILLIACCFAALGLFVSGMPFARAHPWPTLFLAPLFSVTSASLIVALGLVELPAELNRRILRLVGRKQS